VTEAHQPVLFAEVMEALSPRSGGFYLDLTLGAGGHAEGILRRSDPDGRLLAFDLDAHAIEIASERLAATRDRLTIAHRSYLHLTEELERLNWPGVDGIVADFGASSMQFDEAARGFSFLREGPLDMRFDARQPLTAAEIINTWDETQLAAIFREYGEERHARRIARAILQARPLETTTQLASVVEATQRGAPQHIHPATRVFQALRIAVNGELNAIAAVLPLAVDALNPGGRLAVISFHSLEDRVVKQAFRAMSTAVEPQPDQPHLQARPARVRLVNRKPLAPTAEEVAGNPRARSAKLRVVEKL